MAKRDYYEVLGLQKGASADQIKSAFRKLAKQHHPDSNNGDSSAEAKFKEINEAYEVLKDEQKRAAYDQMGHAAFQHGMGGGGRGAHGFDYSSFSDVFDDLFGEMMGGGRRGQSGRGADLRYDLTIELEEAFSGKKAQIRVPTSITCETCKGSGAEPGTQPATCPTCRGNGRIRRAQGFFSVEQTCMTCQGSGRIIPNPCKTCGGKGAVRQEKTLSVTIPAGVDDGMKIRLSGNGEAGVRGAPAGDLYIFLHVAPHRLFQRDGVNIHCRVPIPMSTAALGGQIEVPSIEGKRLAVTIPAGTQSGRQIRLRGKGMTELQGHGRGDMHVELAVETPVNLTRRQIELLQEFDRAGNSEDGEDGGHHPESEGFFRRVKDFWTGLRD
ncbi:molecular chaperone DnaJ [Geminicoccus roseus]|uniref:molecular chaperone DnaJ n=1 Tax=Geminicoccus roseus TaxID=404900 RepID=UPI0004858216|nr:molecular chaperone DnaJ [Geminicoccus roseus]